MGKLRYTIEDCKRIAAERGGECLSGEYTNDTCLMEWKCNVGHIWRQTFKNIKHGGKRHNGSWCPECGGSKPLNIEKCNEIAKINSGKCLSIEYKNARTKYKWQCDACHHVWENTYDHVRQGQWCPKCSGNIIKTFEEVKQVIESKSGVALFNATDLKNNQSLLQIKCGNGHVWKIRYCNLMQNRWCHECSYGRTQRELKNILQNIFHLSAISNFRGFAWLKRKTQSQEIDIWFPDIKLAVEYDGKQHFYPVCFGGISEKEAKNNFKKTKQLDKIKNKKIAQHPEDIKYFVRFNYKEKITKEYVIEKLLKAGINPEDIKNE